MKKYILPLVLTIVSFSILQAQPCSKLFISKYLEGYSNNSAIEIYNPTNTAIDLSAYTIGRFRNGTQNYEPQALPAVMLQPYDTYLAGIDKRDSLGTCYEIPMWNGYQEWDVCLDGTTGLPIIDSNGDTVYCVQYQNVSCSGGNDIPHHKYDNTYKDFLDLQGKVDGFFNPNYVSGGNNPMYFNGDDAVALVLGSIPANDGSNVMDVVGVVGEDPGDSWVTASGYWITKDRSLVKKPFVEEGRLVVKGVAAPADTLHYSEWDIYPKNTFHVIDGGHQCSCDPNYVSTKQINQIDFQVYPNPATSNGAVMIEAKGKIQRVQILNTLGQLINTINYKNNQVRQEVSIPNITSGLYLISIEFEDHSITTRKLMVK